MLLKPAQREYRTWVLDSRRWDHYHPRPDDIIIATYSKCGTTWMQRIVSLLVFQSAEPRPIMEISAWLDRRFGNSVESVLETIGTQEHRRFLKSHLPLDGLPFYDEVKYIHVSRDGRDACMSYHNHGTGLKEPVLELLDQIGLQDESIGRPFPRVPADPAEYFHRWVADVNVAHPPFLHYAKTWWEARQHANVLLVHYNDLKADLSGEMERIADFLEISIDRILWPELVAAAGFDAMCRDGATLMASMADTFQDGSRRFFHKGSNERWRGVFRDEDLAQYDAKVRALLAPECARWVARGRLETGEPRLMH
jgi:aryl sulfotransferase